MCTKGTRRPNDYIKADGQCDLRNREALRVLKLYGRSRGEDDSLLLARHDMLAVSLVHLYPAVLAIRRSATRLGADPIGR